MEYVEKVKLFNEIAGNKEEFTRKSANLYTSLLFEELAELIESLNCEDFNDTKEYLNNMSLYFKSGEGDYAFDNVDRVEFLDACADINVVSIGAGMAIGGDVYTALHQVADNNLTKYEIIDDEYVVLRDENGKIKKPANFKPVDLSNCLK